MRDGGKGDKRRPLVIPEEKFNSNWDAIFGKKDNGTSRDTRQSDDTRTDCGGALHGREDSLSD